jgi:hypothetical protein
VTSERSAIAETSLYEPVKRFLEERGYEVRAEVYGCDVVAVRGDEMVVVELKTAMSLTLILQGIDRLKITDLVYLAVPAPKRTQMARWSETVQLCRRLGLGLLTVRPNARIGSGVEAAADPVPYKPRPAKARRQRVLGEFRGRSGDHNLGGSASEPRITAYREAALLVADELLRSGPAAVREVRRATGCSRAGDILAKNYYGWFERQAPGVYGLAPAGVDALERLAHVLETATRRQDKAAES